MGNITDIQQYLKQKDFNEQVLPFFETLGTNYEFWLEEEECLFTMPYKEDFLYVFLCFIPRNEQTSKPNIVDRFFNVKSNPRQSKGEWVVRKIFTINTSYHEDLMAYAALHSNSDAFIPDILADLQK